MYTTSLFAFGFSLPYLQRFIEQKKNYNKKKYHLYKFIPGNLI